MASADLREALEKFVKFARNLKGDEKSEAQPFLDHFFRALAAKEKKGEPITPPGLPLPNAEHAPFITDDCIRVTPLAAAPRKLL